ncbi:MAG TPA: pyrroline-5-carboxylate reductase [Caulobacteraceae bacterium]|jgi:pyrroline-5-carboxylate reductase|nr:pyrroline-5-carboxylate reductase [Caulobacteraceae bacterium]
MTTPILVLGAGRMGGALVEGWGRVGAFSPADLILRDPNPGADALAAAAAGAILNPPDQRLIEARTVLMAVKPQVWRMAAGAVADLLSPDAVIVSIAAGVRAADLADGFQGRAVARVMPTTAVAIAKGVASVYAPDPAARACAHALFDPVATVVDLADEGLMDAATAVSGSGPAYVYAFVEALEAAGQRAGLPDDAAKALARATVAGASALMAESGIEPSELRRQVTSPAGTTEAALKVLLADDGFGPLLQRAVDAAVARARELAG